MALRPLLLSAVVGIAALGAFHAPPAVAAGSVSISVGTSPHYRSQYRPSYGSHHGVRHDRRYDRRHHGNYDHGRHYRGHQRPGYTFVPGHWAYGQRGRVWVPDQYVRVQPRYDRRYDNRYDHRYDSRVIYRSSPTPPPLPGGFYRQRGG